MTKQRYVLMLATLTVTITLAAAAFIVLVNVWIPTKGKAWVEAELERAFPIDVSIRSMRYAPLRGLLLKDVRVMARASRDTWFSAPTMEIAIGWPALLGGQVVFHATAPADLPCRATLSSIGRYALRSKTFSASIQTSECAVKEIAGPLARLVPPSLTEGQIRLTLRIVQRPAHALTIAGHLTGSQVAWTTPTWHAGGDLTIEGTAMPPLQPTEPWTLHAVIAVRSATLDGIPSVGTISGVEGTARLDGDRLDILSLAGSALGSRWTVEGTVAPIRSPAVELLISSRAELASLTEGFAALKSDWHVAGPADIRAVCRGPLGPRPFLDCLTRAELRDVTVTHAKLASPIAHVAGRVAYDALEQHLSVEALSATIAAESLSVNGDVRLRPPAQLAVTISGRLPVESVKGWLPSDGPVTDLGGAADLDLAVHGRLPDLRYTGQATLRDVHVTCAAFPNRVDHLAGTVDFQEDRIDLRDLSFRVNEQPVTLMASVTSLDAPRIAATVQLPQGSLTLAGRLMPDRFTIDDARGSLEHSRLHFAGFIARSSARPSALDADGVVELADLEHLPFVPLPVLSPWHLQGPAAVQAQFRGRFSSWTDAALRGRLTADRLIVRGVPIEHLVCNVDQADRILRVHVPVSLVADGKFLGELSLEHRAEATRYTLEADLMQLQLAALTQTIPAWHDRPVRGTASAHAKASGLWERRASWQAEGWLNASGEQLGEMPLLDKVFRGLFGMLGDRLGLEALRRAQITQVSVQWQLADERFRTESLRLGGLTGTEPIAIYAKGSVGMDQTLDFVVEPELSEGTLLEAPTTSTLTNTVLKAAGRLERLRRLIGRHRLTGTLQKPEYRFEFSSKELFKQAAPGDVLQNILDSLR